MIGNETLAQSIRTIAWHEREDEDGYIRLDSQNDAPEGWEYVGSGGYRHCFKGPDGHIYKVPTNYTMQHAQDINERVYRRYLLLVDAIKVTGSTVQVAECDYFSESNVMVQRFVDGAYPDEDCEDYYSWTDAIMRLGKRAGFFLDVHSGNFIMADGQVVLIDW